MALGNYKIKVVGVESFDKTLKYLEKNANK